jgi:hypothetical protein
MPQPVQGTFSYRPKILLQQRPAHAARIGLVVAEWAALEEHLVEMFAYSLFAMALEERGAMQVAKTALEQIDSLTVRLEVMGGLLKTRVKPEEHKYFAETLRPEIRKRASERNRVAHSNWMLCDTEPDYYVVARFPDGDFKYSLKDFEDISDRIIETSNNIATFLMQIRRDDGALLALARGLQAQRS